MIDWTLSHQKITPHDHNLIIIWLRLSYNDDDDLDCQPYIHRPPDLVITFSILSYDDDDLDGDDDVDYDYDMRMMMMIEEMVMIMTLMVVITTYPDTHRPPDLIIIFSRFWAAGVVEGGDGRGLLRDEEHLLQP